MRVGLDGTGANAVAGITKRRAAAEVIFTILINYVSRNAVEDGYIGSSKVEATLKVVKLRLLFILTASFFLHSCFSSSCLLPACFLLCFRFAAAPCMRYAARAPLPALQRGYLSAREHVALESEKNHHVALESEKNLSSIVLI